MKTVGLIVEYNPLHNGHVYHLQQSKQITGADAVIAVMSGNFLQRGEPALVNKWARAEMALHAGADLVLELPSIYAYQPAEWFAYGAVSVLEASGIVDAVCFGSEHGSIEELEQLAQWLHEEDDVFKQELQKQLKLGIGYPAAYSQAVKNIARFETAADLSQPNNSLGLHYLIALKRLQSRIIPCTIKRIKAEYHQPHMSDSQIASATAIRRQIASSGNLQSIASYVPSSTLRILKREFEAGRGPVDWDRFTHPLYHSIVTKSLEELHQIHGMTEGLEYRMKQLIYQPANSNSVTASDLIAALQTKRYTAAKIQRTLLNVLLNCKKSGMTRNKLKQGAQYIRVLGFNEKGQQLLKKMKKTAKAPIITNVNKKNAALLAADIQASSVYALAYRSVSSMDLYREFRQHPIKFASQFES